VIVGVGILGLDAEARCERTVSAISSSSVCPQLQQERTRVREFQPVIGLEKVIGPASSP
jgi:hypothetical protein